MKNRFCYLIASLLLIIVSQPVNAAIIDLFDWGFNLDGTSFCGDPGDGCDNNGQSSLPTAIDASGFDFGTGLGSIDVSINGTGAHFFDVFIDLDIDAAINSFDNETASTNGSVATGQSWEIDEPGFGSFNDGTANLPYFGDIFGNFLASSLDQMIFFDAFDNQSLIPPIDDVSMALGWDFTLAAGELATINILSSTVQPLSGFSLTHSDPDSPESIYFSSTLTISNDNNNASIPELNTFFLLSFGFSALAMFRMRRSSRPGLHKIQIES